MILPIASVTVCLESAAIVICFSVQIPTVLVAYATAGSVVKRKKASKRRHRTAEYYQ